MEHVIKMIKSLHDRWIEFVKADDYNLQMDRKLMTVYFIL